MITFVYVLRYETRWLSRIVPGPSAGLQERTVRKPVFRATCGARLLMVTKFASLPKFVRTQKEITRKRAVGSQDRTTAAYKGSVQNDDRTSFMTTHKIGPTGIATPVPGK